MAQVAAAGCGIGLGSRAWAGASPDPLPASPGHPDAPARPAPGVPAALLQATPPAERRRAEALLASVAHLPPVTSGLVAQRVDAISRQLLGTPYAWNPTGEGPGELDSDPPLVFGRFDCMTFVETVAALARSTRLDEVFETLAALRYASQAARFEHRTHFVTVDWWPAAQGTGILAAVLQPGQGLSLTVRVDKAGWVRQLPAHPMYRRLVRESRPAGHRDDLPGDPARQRLDRWADQLANQPPATGQLHGLPASDLLAAGRVAPPWQGGDLFAIARPDAVLTQSAGGGDPVAHVGFVLPAAAGWVLRSASLQDRGVSDVPIASALRSTARQGSVRAVAMWRLLPQRG